jgi:hypothetical protein
MKVGDLVKLCSVNYPRHKGEIGVLIELPKPISRPQSWAVIVAGKMHPYTVVEEDMEVISDNR